MRVLIATNMYPTDDAPYYGVFVRQQELSLRALGVEIDVCAHLGRHSKWAYAHGLADLVRCLRAKRHDLIHTHHTYSTVLALLARRLAGKNIPIVETFHEGQAFQKKRLELGFAERLRTANGLKAWALRRVQFAIPVHRELLPIVLGPTAARVPSRVIPVGIDMERFQPGDRAAARARLGWDAGAFIVFFPADPKRPEKRFDLARGAFDIFARARPDARLVTGGGFHYDQMPDLMRACNAVLTPTEFETGPLVVREAMACERPVVSTDVGDVRETFGGLPGLFICDWKIEDIAAKLEEAAQVRQPFGGRQRLIDRELDLGQVARRVLAVYEEVLQQSGAT